MITLAALLMLSAVAVLATVRDVIRDGYRPVADHSVGARERPRRSRGATGPVSRVRG